MLIIFKIIKILNKIKLLFSELILKNWIIFVKTFIITF